jgi:hypothetical protein
MVSTGLGDQLLMGLISVGLSIDLDSGRGCLLCTRGGDYSKAGPPGALRRDG